MYKDISVLFRAREGVVNHRRKLLSKSVKTTFWTARLSPLKKQKQSHEWHSSRRNLSSWYIFIRYHRPRDTVHLRASGCEAKKGLLKCISSFFLSLVRFYLLYCPVRYLLAPYFMVQRSGQFLRPSCSKDAWSTRPHRTCPLDKSLMLALKSERSLNHRLRFQQSFALGNSVYKSCV